MSDISGNYVLDEYQYCTEISNNQLIITPTIIYDDYKNIDPPLSVLNICISK